MSQDICTNAQYSGQFPRLDAVLPEGRFDFSGTRPPASPDLPGAEAARVPCDTLTERLTVSGRDLAVRTFSLSTKAVPRIAGRPATDVILTTQDAQMKRRHAVFDMYRLAISYVQGEPGWVVPRDGWRFGGNLAVD